MHRASFKALTYDEDDDDDEELLLPPLPAPGRSAAEALTSRESSLTTLANASGLTPLSHRLISNDSDVRSSPVFRSLLISYMTFLGWTGEVRGRARKLNARHRKRAATDE